MTDVKLENKKRGSIKAKLTCFSKFVKGIGNMQTISEIDIIQLKERLKVMDQVKCEFDEVQGVIEMLVNEEELESQLTIRESFENDYFSHVALAKKIISDNDDNMSSSSHIRSSRGEENQPPEGYIPRNGDPNISHIKLPTINLPKFNGIYQNWLEFRDTFRSLIHDNNSINSVQKFHYLRASLEADAAVVIKSLEISSANYEVAWSALLERYDNNKLLIHNHVKSLFAGESIGKESASGLRKIIDDFSKNLRALEQLNQPVTEWDTLVVYLLATKLDNVTLREWEHFKADLENPTFQDIKSFLKARADMLEMVAQNQTEKRRVANTNTRGFLATEASANNRECIVCGEAHYIQQCKNFLKLSPNEREKKIRDLRACFNCLKKGHQSKVCRRGTCFKCNEKHHTLLHREQCAYVSSNQTKTDNSNENISKPNATSSGESSVTLSACGSIDHVFLSTAYVQVPDHEGNMHTVRALLDSGAQSSFITKELCQRLKLNTHTVSLSVRGLNNIASNINFKSEMTVHSLINSHSFTRWFFVVDMISGNIPAIKVDVSKLAIPGYINLADTTFFKPSRVDMLIGSDLFWDLICAGQISLGQNNPVLQKTKLGWVVSGPISLKTSHVSHSVMCNFVQNLEPDSDVQKYLVKFWEVEEIHSKPLMSSDEIACERHFINNTKRNDEGRFIVTLPLRESVVKLGDSFDIAKKRFLALERKFHTSPDFKKLYCDFIEEYVALGHMEKVRDPDQESPCYYMPHHGVLKNDSLTTKLRVVFDASSPTTSGLSLNNLQYVGPSIQENICSILLRFRQHKFVVCADITKMYRQVLIAPEQRRLQRIIWRKNPGDPVDTYELKTVTYGTTAASFLAIRCLFQLAEDNAESNPKMANIIKNDFYVDDLLSGADDLEEAAQICTGVSAILKQGGFELRKFYSNNKEVLKDVNVASSDFNVIDFSEHESAKTLGITWSPHHDKLIYKISPDLKEIGVSKRCILSSIAQIFDPLGLLAPCVVLAKMLLQKLWLEKLTWDETVPPDIAAFWRDFRSELPALNEVYIDRRVIGEDADTLEVHGFADASEEAYGACVYIRTVTKGGQAFARLLCAKSKVAPLKTITLPRLELMAAHLLARLVMQVKDSLRIKCTNCVLWADSTIVLGWLKQAPNKLKTFVGTRVAEIQNMTISDCWRHVPSKQNPADLASRGLMPKALMDNAMWWHGPSFLKEDRAKWPEVSVGTGDLPDIRKPKRHVFIAACLEENFIKKYSDLNKLKRVTAYILRFRDNCRARNQGQTARGGLLQSFEIDQALKRLIKISQSEYFQREIDRLSRGKAVKSSKISNLNPFIDSNDILRVGGRLASSQFPFEKKHPAILASKSHLAQLLVRHTHLCLLHAGPQHTLATVREMYWIIGGRMLTKGIIRKCIPCFRYNAKPTKPIMAPLPEMRLRPRQPFETVGVDYAGPIMIKSRSGRGFKTSKAYICLFICCVTKATHIELVTDLTKESFMLALKRFVSRRGKPTCIHSDNGTTFVAARNELSELGKFIVDQGSELAELCLKNEIKWRFIPPYSPHFGGLWEAGVKSMKHHLRRVAKDLLFTFEQLYTLLVEVEAILNSRPLSPLSDSPHDLTPLTPSHFLVGRPLQAVPERDLSDVPTNRLSMFQHLSQLKQHIWKRWSKEYISELQRRTKWKLHQDSLRAGALVLIKEDHQPPMRWKLGRIVDLHKGSDGVARVATIKTETGLIKRSFAKICPLPLDEELVLSDCDSDCDRQVL